MLKLAMSKKANTTVKSIKVGAKSDWDKSNLMGNAFPQVGDRFDAQKEPALFVSEKELLRMRSLANLPLDCGVWQWRNESAECYIIAALQFFFSSVMTCKEIPHYPDMPLPDMIKKIFFTKAYSNRSSSHMSKYVYIN